MKVNKKELRWLLKGYEIRTVSKYKPVKGKNQLSTKLGYRYPFDEDKNVTEYIKTIRYLPKDAKHIK